jgi:hypothetical protein
MSETKEQWAANLSEDEQQHLKLNLIKNLETFKSVRKMQVEMDNLVESHQCPICVSIAKKLGLE